MSACLGQLRSRLRELALRQRIVLSAHAALAIGLVPMLVLAPSKTPPVAPFAVLIAAGITAEAREIELARGIGLDASTAVALVALALWGFLPAYVLLVCSIAGKSVLVGVRADGSSSKRQLAATTKDLLRVGNLANAGSAGWSLLGAAAALALADGTGSPPHALAAVMAAGIVGSVVQLATGPAIHWPGWYGESLSSTLRSAKQAAWVELAMIALGASTVALALAVGPLGFMLLAPAIVLPLLVPDPAKARPANELSHAAATLLYSEALAAMLRMDRTSTRRLPSVIELLRKLRRSDLIEVIEGSTIIEPRLLKELARVDEGVYCALTVNEHWNGSGPTGIAAGDVTPLPQLLAFAEEWAYLTAIGGPELAHEEAFVRLRALAGRRHDPRLLAAAERVIARERKITATAACQPRLHRRRERLWMLLPHAVDCVAQA